jgi:membrane protease subunit HflC
MKNLRLTVIVAALVVAVFVSVLFLFQVRQTEVAVVTTFGKFSRAITEPGLYLRWPWPANKVYKFDNRQQIFERKFEQTTTADGRSLIVCVFIGWQIADPRLFIERFAQGDVVRAEQALEGVVRDAKNGVIGQHPFGELISTNKSHLKLRQMEGEMFKIVQDKAAANYGIRVTMLGVKQLGLPESITSKVFDRMRAERQRLVKQFQSEGEAEAIRIRAEADRIRQETLARADAEAMTIRGQAEAEAAKHFAVLQKEPELASFLIQLNSLANSLKERSTLVLDPQTPPFNLLRGDALAPAEAATNKFVPASSHEPIR